MLSGWLRNPEKRTQLFAYLLLGGSIVWSAFRIARSMQLLFDVSHDGFMYYSLWFVMAHRDVADIALRQSLYLPHTWLFLTPLFVFGWPVAKVLLLLVNGGAVTFIWWRLSNLAELRGIKRWLLLAFFCSWLSTGLVLGLGNLALVCVAAVLAAYPFNSAKKGLLLALSAMKQSLVFPVYFQLLLKRPLALLIPSAVFAVCGLGVLAWAGLSVTQGLGILKAWSDNVSTWTSVDHTCLRRLFILVSDKPLFLAIANWITWFSLFGVCFRYIKDPLSNLAAMLLLSLLPMYHHQYDMVAAAPALAVLLRRCRLAWPVLLTVLLATNIMSPVARFAPAAILPIARALESAYYPLVILGLLAVLISIEVRGYDPSPTGQKTEPQSALLREDANA